MSTFESLEMRWFFEGHIPEDVRKWFEGIKGGDVFPAYPRQDIYLLVGDREDLGLKVREGKLEIKVREKDGEPRDLPGGKGEGMVEEWIKYGWVYPPSIRETSVPFKNGKRVRTTKSRTQRKFKVLNGELLMEGPDDRTDDAFIVELTEVSSQVVDEVEVQESDDKKTMKTVKSDPVRHWTFAIEAVTKKKFLDQSFDAGAKHVLVDFPEKLTLDNSYGYPAFAHEVAEVAERASEVSPGALSASSA